MDGDVPIALFREPGWQGSRTPQAPRHPPFRRTVFFDRHELALILDLYGTMVASGRWRDYALEYSDEAAIFAIYRHAFDAPIFRIIKRPRWMRRHGTFTVISAGGEVLGHGVTLAVALGAFRRRSLRLIEGRARAPR